MTKTTVILLSMFLIAVHALMERSGYATDPYIVWYTLIVPAGFIVVFTVIGIVEAWGSADAS